MLVCTCLILLSGCTQNKGGGPPLASVTQTSQDVSYRSPYDFHQPLPYVNARLGEVFPQLIRNSNGVERRIAVPDDRYLGFTFSYLGGAVTMTAVKCLDKELTLEQLLVRKEPTQAALEYFKTGIYKQFAVMPTYLFGSLDDVWQAQGRDAEGRSWLSWINALWVFTVSGQDDEHFNLAVRASRFVNYKGMAE